jgi:hypothetical protein
VAGSVNPNVYIVIWKMNAQSMIRRVTQFSGWVVWWILPALAADRPVGDRVLWEQVLAVGLMTKSRFIEINA